MEKQIDLILQELIKINQRLSAVESRMTAMENRMSKLEGTVKQGFKQNRLEHNEIIRHFDAQYFKLVQRIEA